MTSKLAGFMPGHICMQCRRPGKALCINVRCGLHWWLCRSLKAVPSDPTTGETLTRVAP